MAAALSPASPNLVLELRGWPEGGPGEVSAVVEIGRGAPVIEAIARGETETHRTTLRIRGRFSLDDLRGWCRAVLAATEGRIP